MLGGQQMSYDIDIGDRDFNVTFNIAPLFYDHIPGEDGGRGGLHALHDKTGKQALGILTDAMERIDKTSMRDWELDAVGEPKFCARYDAKNGWGSTVNGLIFLARLTAACANNPRCKVKVRA
jgi:hypothetical protein